MRGEEYDGPVRSVYEALSAQQEVSAARYHEFVDALHPVWLEEVVCPVHRAVASLCDAAEAAAQANRPDMTRHHETARAYLYKALADARLLTLDEALQDVVADDLLRQAHAAQPGEPSSSSPRRTVHAWEAWRSH